MNVKFKKKNSNSVSQKMNATLFIIYATSALFYSIEFFKFKYLLVPFYSANEKFSMLEKRS